MSVIAPALRRPWLPIAITVVVVGVASAIVTSRVLDSPASPSEALPATIAAPEVEQATWKVRTRAMGSLGKPSARERKRAAAAGHRVGVVIKQVYNDLFLDPARLKGSVRARFSRSAGAALLASKSGPPRAAEDVRTIVRKAKISVQVPATRHAVAEVRVVAKGNAEKSFRVVHRSTLYLERRSGWTVIAFDLNQGRRK